VKADDILKMFGLDKEPEGETKPKRKIYEEEEEASDEPPSPTALVLSEWERNKGKELSGSRGVSNRLDPLALADFFGAAFQSKPELAPNCLTPRRKQFIKDLLETPEFKKLHVDTQKRVYPSKMAAASISRQYLKLTDKDEKRKPPKNEEEAAKQEEKKAMESQLAVCKAVREAQEEVDEYIKVMSVLGKGPGDPEEKDLAPEAINEVFQQVRNNWKLKQIMEEAGPFQRSAESQQQRKTNIGMDELVGIKLDDKIENLIDEEMLEIVFKPTQANALRRLIEKEALAFHYQGIQKVGKGPVVVLTDGSASMAGWKEIRAKAFALGMAWIAKHQKRWCCLVEFASGSAMNVCILKPDDWNERNLIEWLLHFYNGGTTYHVPFKEVPFTLWPKMVQEGLKPGKTDMIIITDGQLDVPWQIKKRFLEWKQKEKCRAIGVMIGAAGAGGIAQCVDEYHNVTNITAESKAVKSCFSI
jgi:uncharacterized protein with von Willebrand factor type A (vWA) domain